MSTPAPPRSSWPVPPPPAQPPAAPDTIGAWLHVAENGEVTVYTGKVEVGQNTRTSLTQAVADELRLPVAAVHLLMGDTEHVPYDRGTFGSRSTPDMAVRLRRAAAAAREALIEMAAEQWESDRSALVVADGKVTHAETGQSFTFGELTHGQPLTRPIGDGPPVTPADAWTVAGTSVPKVDARGFVTGAHRYASDVARPGMLHGKVLRPPAYGARLEVLDASAAGQIPGVTVVHDGDFAGAAGPDTDKAARAAAALRPTWSAPPPQPSSADLYGYLKSHPPESQSGQRWPDNSAYEAGSVEEGMAAADVTLRQTYTVAYIAHAPLEPRAAVAEWAKQGQGGHGGDGPGDGIVLTVWAGTQRPFGVREQLAQAFGLAEEQIRVVVPDTGSGYGGKHTGEAAIEAARLARAAGRPVKVQWTREEEFTWAYFRPAGVIEIASGARRDGTLLAWEAHNYNSGAGALRPPYAVPHQRVRFHPAASPLRQGSYRALAATANVFARETHLDEMAHRLGVEPLAFRLQNLGDARLRAVLEAAVERFGWGRELGAHSGAGIGLGVEKGGYIAMCAEVRVDPGARTVRVVRVVEAFECGAVVNPDHLCNQIEGAVVQALGGALYEAIDFADGRILNPRLSQYRVPRFADAPRIEAVLVDRKDLPSAGAGETPLIGLAPAVGNAIFAACGVRLRAMPLAPGGAIPAAGEA
jgi:isoquinoline 1-oxidoreductase